MAFIIVPENDVDTSKFNSCKHRSENEEEYIKSHCCSSIRKTKGFICNELKLKGLIPLQCINCNSYENKNG